MENITAWKVLGEMVESGCAQMLERSSGKELHNMTRAEMADEIISLLRELDRRKLNIVYRFIKKLF